jgi:cysteine desulfurase/selenocysteine lyase
MNVEKIRKDFPILETKMNGYPLNYLDNAATTQKPLQVIKEINKFYLKSNANIRRGVYKLSEDATLKYEETRKKTAELLKAKPSEVIFTRNTTESINLVAYCFEKEVKKNDFILLTDMEHHSNIVPWYLIARKKGAKLKKIPFDSEGILDMSKAEELIEEKPVFLALTQASNVLGTINNIEKISKIAKKNGVKTLVDAAQSAPHMRINVKKLDCDFLAFSAHKMLGPLGVGVLYGKTGLLESMPPFMGGGEMIENVSKEITFAEPPVKFEAGTPNIEGVIAFKKAIEYLLKIGFQNIQNHEKKLLKTAFEGLSEIKNLKIHGPSNLQKRTGLISFSTPKHHPHDIAYSLSKKGIAVRAGHHCAQPLMEKLGENASTRASFYIYNTEEEVESLVKELKEILK